MRLFSKFKGNKYFVDVELPPAKAIGNYGQRNCVVYLGIGNDGYLALAESEIPKKVLLDKIMLERELKGLTYHEGSCQPISG